jgi:DNA-binding transcriptional LysR family regulator
MDLWQLKIFCNVVEQKSFSKAGRRIHLSQPTVSSHIKDLENHLGCRLINRLAKEAVPTREGELLYRYALKMIALHDEAESALNQFKGRISGNLAIGGSTIPGGYILPRLIGGFLKTHPDVHFSLRVADTRQIVLDIRAGELELGVVGAGVSDRQIVQEILLEDEMCLIVPADHPWGSKKQIEADRLREENFIVRESGSGTLKSIQQTLAAFGYPLEDFTIAAELGSTEAVVQGIKSRVGISILSPIAVEEEIQSGILKSLRIKSMPLKRNFYLTRHKYRSLSPPAQAFDNFLKDPLSARAAPGAFSRPGVNDAR